MPVSSRFGNVKLRSCYYKSLIIGGQLSGGQLSGGQLSGGQLSGGQLSGGQLSGGQLSHTRDLSTRYTQYCFQYLDGDYNLA